MDIVKIKAIDEKRFNVYAAYSRSSIAAYFTKEVAWYANGDDSILGVVLFDLTDEDFASIMLVRDKSRKFRAFDFEANFPTAEEATTWLHNTMKWHTGIGMMVFTQGDASKQIDLFKPLVQVENQHPYFVRLNRDTAYIPAKVLINQMMPHYIDVDGNFVEQFQTSGFDSRMWELCLFGYFTEENLVIDRSHRSPDFMLSSFDITVGVEAVTVGRKDNPPRYCRMSGDLPRPNVLAANANEMPIRFGSPLFSKLNKRYWLLDHLRGKPLILAIADFHDDLS